MLTGVSGGLDYKIMGSEDDMHLYIGFSNPPKGTYKTFISVNKGKSAEWAYDQIKDGSYKTETEFVFV